MAKMYPSPEPSSFESAAERNLYSLLKRELGIPSQETGGERFSLDHLFLDEAGILTLVELKRSSDTRLRRGVMGQNPN